MAALLLSACGATPTTRDAGDARGTTDTPGDSGASHGNDTSSDAGTARAFVWTGGGADDRWSTGANWLGGTAPSSGAEVRFAGTTRMSPTMDRSHELASLAFDDTAGSFTVSGTNVTLTLTGGMTNRSTKAQTLTVPLVLAGPQTLDAAAGDLTITGMVSGHDAVTVAGLGAVTMTGGQLGTTLEVRDGATLALAGSKDETVLTTDRLTVGGTSGATLRFAVAGRNKVVLDAQATTLNGTTTIHITRCPRAANVDYPLLSGYTGGTLVLGSEPKGWHGSLTVTGSIVSYRVTAVDFVHPGVLSTREDLLRMRAKVDAGVEPWKSGYAALAANAHSQSTYVAHPHPTPCRGGGCASAGLPEDYMTMAHDAAAAYQAALRYWITEDPAFADAAVRNMDGYAREVQYLTGDSNALLMMGAQGFQWAAAAELLRDYQPWVDSGGFARFQTFLLDKFYKSPTNGNGLHAFLQQHNGTCASHYWLNWDLFAMDALIAIAVVCDRRDLYDEAIEYYRSGAGNGAVNHALWFMHPGYLGQSQEAGRDIGHASLDPILLGQFCEVAWNQGDDMFGVGDNALLAMSEYQNKVLSGGQVPWVNYVGCDVTTTNLATGTMYRPGADLIWNHYVNRRGLAAPSTMPWAIAGRPENGGGAYGNNSGGYDQIGFTTLTHALEPISVSPAPSGLKVSARKRGEAMLWWWGSAYATKYTVKRATSAGGSFTPVGTVAGNVTPLFTDTGLTPGQRYTYTVSATVNDVETADSAPASVTANDRLFGTVIGSNGTFTPYQVKEAAFDDDLTTFYDALHPSGDWAGLDLGAAHVITTIGYVPRAGYADRMLGGQLQGSNVADFSSGVVTLVTIATAPPEGMVTTQDVSVSDVFRYVRYLSPANGYSNVAELEFHGHL